MCGGRFDHRQLDWRAKRIRADNVVWTETSQLLGAIQSNSKSTRPDEVLEYMRRRLEGDVPRPKGRPSLGDVGFFRDQLIRHHYRQYLDWLTPGKKSLGLSATYVSASPNLGLVTAAPIPLQAWFSQ